METDRLRIHDSPNLREPRLVLGFSGWMDGGEVSTGTVGYLARTLSPNPWPRSRLRGSTSITCRAPWRGSACSVHRPASERD